MEQVKIKVQKRDERGKKIAKKLRKEEMIPAVVYRKGEETISISVPEKDFIHALHTAAGENVIIALEIDKADKKSQNKTAIIKEIQNHPLKDSILHIDFQEISLTETITVKVPIETKGEAVGVKRDGGVLEHMLWDLEIECLPMDIPQKIEVDIEKLEIGNEIQVKDVILPPNIKVLNNPEAIVISVGAPMAEEIVKEAVPGEEVAEPELIRKEKKPELEEEAEEDKAKESKEQK